MESAMRRARSGNLTALLVAVAVLEFFINRLAGRLFFPRPTLTTGGGSQTTHIVGVAGPFLFQLTAILALAVLTAAFFGLFRRGELYPRAVRFSVIVIALFFAALSGQAIVRGHVPQRFFLYLEICFAFLAGLTAVAFWLTKTELRVKIGVTLFALPGALRAFGVVGASMGMRDPRPGEGGVALAATGALAMLIGGIAAPFLLPPRPARERRWQLPAAVSLVATTAFIAALIARFDLMQASALYGLRIELPPL